MQNKNPPNGMIFLVTCVLNIQRGFPPSRSKKVLLRSRFATEICIMANGVGFGSAEVAQEKREMGLSHGKN